VSSNERYRMRVAFVGLGAMGAPMARRLLAAGHRLAVVDTRPEAVAEAVEVGGEPAATPAAAAAGADAAVSHGPPRWLGKVDPSRT
jgi:3-hydroxyisobutyrate dehydrogenase